MKTTPKIRVAQFGLGPIGLETIKLAASKPWAEVLGAVDIDPAKIGRDLGELTGLRILKGRKVHGSLEALDDVGRPDVIFHTTVSRLKEACAQIKPMVARGINVVSSCEELLFPSFRDPSLAASLDRVCKNHGARVTATGVNPGYVMDLLPICLTGVSQGVSAVHVQRVVNASTRREPLQRKIGSGLAPTEFRRRLREGRAGHAGLKDSLALIAHALGWRVKDILESGDAVIAEKDIGTAFLEVKRGQTCGLHQWAEARLKGKVCLTLDLKMYLDAPNPRDAVQVEGEPPLNVVIEGGVAGDQATVAALVNTVPRILQASPGSLLVTDLPLPRMA